MAEKAEGEEAYTIEIGRGSPITLWPCGILQKYRTPPANQCEGRGGVET